jgi:hypothetical protein
MQVEGNDMKRLYAQLLGFGTFLSCFVSTTNAADMLSLDDALRATYTACVDIDDRLHDLKVLACVNTAVTSVGTAAGVGASVTGFVKAATDNKIAQLEEQLKQYIIENNGLNISPENTDLNTFIASFEKHLKQSANKTDGKQAETISGLQEKSKKLGNWRTGLLATNTATNIAGVAISASTINKDDFQGQIDACISATKALSSAIMQARMNGEDVTEAEGIYKACTEYEYVDISPIIKRGTGALISSSVGAATGLAGTVVSGAANSNKVRNDNTDAGKQKEKDLNIAANVLSVGATAASISATVFNATQIAAIKNVAGVSEKCTGVLK